MGTIRQATVADAELITTHRHRMYTDNAFVSEEELDTVDTYFLPWVQERLADGRYVGLLMEQDGAVVAGAGIFFMDFPPHYMHHEAGRAYLLNFFTAHEGRGKGYANALLRACVDKCRERGSTMVTLHASRFGRPIYTKFGFKDLNEMMLKLD